MSAEASVIHLNVVNFMASVEARKNPELRDRPFVVALPAAARARILDLSRRALKEGVEAGMRIEDAERRLPGLRVVPPSPEAYSLANKAMEAICARYAPLLENSGGGHFFLDMGGTRRLFGDYIDSAARIRNEVARDIGIDAATALAANKLVAKVGTRSLRPDGFVSVREGEEEAFLSHQDIILLPGVGARIGRILTTVGIREIGELARLPDEEVRGLLGRLGTELRDAARGRDGSRVEAGNLSGRRVAARRRFDGDVLDEAAILATLLTLVESCGLELRRSRLATWLVEVELTYADEVAGRGSTRASRALSLDEDILAAARDALARAHTRRLRISTLALSLSRLEPSGIQLDLFEPTDPFRPGTGKAIRLSRLQSAVDEARERFGCGAVTRCAALNAAASRDV